MFRWFFVLCVGALCVAPVQANGLLVPSDTSLPPLALVRHQVRVMVDTGVSVTDVTQTFRNHTDRPLEATYIFPVPRGASVTRFSMWVNGKEEKGELVEAGKARQIYTDIVRRLQDPGLLEYIGSNLLKVRVFPVPARGEQKLRLSFTALAERDAGLVRYVYPLKTSEKNAQVLEKFSLDLTLKSNQPIQNVYSPTHQVAVDHQSDRKVLVHFKRDKCTLDKDFELYYSPGGKDVGLTALTHRPGADANGHVMLLLSPRAELGRSQQVPRDFVFVLDTSGSMAGPKMEQARKALKFCLNSLHKSDRFALLHFATTVNKYRDHLTGVSQDEVVKACHWVEELQANGGTAINDALAAALELRPGQTGRTFTVVFFTDGQPTVGEVNPERILKNTLEKNTANTRIFTFGVGDDVNAVLLDRLADQTRAVCTYVRPAEDIEVKVSGLYARISHPVLTDLKLKAGDNITLSEMYPSRLPDLFHGGQLAVLARYKGHGHATVTLTGKVGETTKEFVYEVDFPEQTKSDKAFVEGLWARRKVGYLLDEIRTNGEKKELVDEVVSLAKKHGITTPYTSYLCVPDSVPVPATRPMTARPGWRSPVPKAYGLGTSPSSAGGGQPGPMAASAPAPSFAPTTQAVQPGMVPPSSLGARSYPNGPRSAPLRRPPLSNTTINNSTTINSENIANNTNCTTAPRPASPPIPPKATVQAGPEGVDLALKLRALRESNRPAPSKARQVAGRTCRESNGVWIDTGVKGSMPTLKVKALSEAYFRLLEQHPQLKDVFALGTRVQWVTPSGTVLAIAPDEGKEKLGDEEITRLFAIGK